MQGRAFALVHGAVRHIVAGLLIPGSAMMWLLFMMLLLLCALGDGTGKGRRP
jgi:hypothetical protein